MGKRKGCDDMVAKLANLYARIEPDVKEQNESLKNLLNKLSLILKDASDICDFNNL